MAGTIALAAVGAGAAGVAFKAARIVKLANSGAKDLGTAGRVTSYVAGKMWTKSVTSNVSRDGLARYRPPVLKQTGPRAGQLTANFEKRISAAKKWNYPNRKINAHLRIKGWF